MVAEELLYSFRSAEPILRLVDTIFDGPASEGLQSRIKHRPFDLEKPGRIDLWPFIEKSEAPDDVPWYAPVDTIPSGNPHRVLARQLATYLSEVLGNGVQLPGPDGNRVITAGDILILVQKRSAVFHALIKELKSCGLPVAGADRLKVNAELAVRDILSLLRFAETPEDDLSLAEALRSPLCGLSEGQLFEVAL